MSVMAIQSFETNIRQGISMLVKLIYTGLYGVIRFPQTGDTLGCFIYSISEDCTEAVIVTSSPRVCVREEVELRIILPVDRSPIKCLGRIAEDKGLIDDIRGYSARIFITQISRIDQRRLELLISQKKALMGRGEYGYRFADQLSVEFTE